MPTDDETLHRIHAAIRAIPRGEVAGYGDVARRAGLPGRARQVARVLSVSDDRSLPWHRVVRSDGRIAFPATHPRFDDQAARLRNDGVTVTNGRVRTARCVPSLDEAVWGPDARPR